MLAFNKSQRRQPLTACKPRNTTHLWIGTVLTATDKLLLRRGGRAAEGGGLLNRYTGKLVSRVRIPSPPPLTCSQKFAKVLFIIYYQLVIDDFCPTRYACICPTPLLSDGTDYKDDRLTSLNARFVETAKKAGMFVRYTDLLKLLKDGVNRFICSSYLVAPIRYLFRYL